MTLIEVLFAYRNLVKCSGREFADKFILPAVRPALHQDIRDSVSEAGEFIDAEGSWMGDGGVI